MEGAAPGLFPSRDPGGSPVERVGFSRAQLCPGPPRSPLGWAGSSGALVCGPPSQRGVGSTPGGSIRGPQQCQGSSPPRKRPKVPFNWPPRPLSQPALLWDFPPFHIPQVPGPRLSPAGSSEAFRDTRRSLQRLHLDPSLSSPPFPPCPLPNSSVGSWHPFPTAVPECHRRGL